MKKLFDNLLLNGIKHEYYHSSFLNSEFLLLFIFIAKILSHQHNSEQYPYFFFFLNRTISLYQAHQKCQIKLTDTFSFGIEARSSQKQK